MREVHYLQQMGREDIPQEAIDLYQKAETFRKYKNSLGITIDWYVSGCKYRNNSFFYNMK